MALALLFSSALIAAVSAGIFVAAIAAQNGADRSFGPRRATLSSEAARLSRLSLTGLGLAILTLFAAVLA